MPEGRVGRLRWYRSRGFVSLLFGLAVAAVMATLSLAFGVLLSWIWPAVDPVIERAVRFVSVHPAIIATVVAFAAGFTWMWKAYRR